MSIEKTAINMWPEAEKRGNFSQAVRVGNTIYVSGTMGIRENGQLVSDVNMLMQIEQAYTNLEITLSKFGASLENVVSETILVTDLEQARMAAMLESIYQQGIPPARTLGEVRQLSIPNAMVSISCIAHV